MNIYSRSSWGARYHDGFGTRAVRNLEVWLHHSVTTQLSPSASVERAIPERARGGVFSEVFMAASLPGCQQSTPL